MIALDQLLKLDLLGSLKDFIITECTNSRLESKNLPSIFRVWTSRMLSLPKDNAGFKLFGHFDFLCKLFTQLSTTYQFCLISNIGYSKIIFRYYIMFSDRIIILFPQSKNYSNFMI